MKMNRINALAMIAALGFSVPAQPLWAGGCATCAISAERCTATCEGLESASQRVACLMACDNAAATCSCDEKVGLRSEDILGRTTHVGDTDAPACHSTTPCGSAYGSCAAWSAYADCGDPWCGDYKWCPDPPICEEGACFGPALRQYRERYRVCFNAQSQSCTEYQRMQTWLSCGC